MLLRVIFAGAVVIVAVAFFAGRPQFKRYRIPSESMEPTIHQGETVSLNRGADVELGDIVIFNGKPQNEPYITDCGRGEACDLPRPITVLDGTYYLVGDNRGASDDSRFWGPVPEDWILGHVERCSAIYFFCSPV